MATDAAPGKRYLSRVEARQLEDWLLKNKLHIETTKPTRTVLAARAAEVVGRTVSPRQVSDCMAVVGVVIESGKNKGAGSSISRHRCDTIMALCKQVETLCTNLGVAVEPAILKALQEPGWIGEGSLNPPKV